ncbi:hypothetical protein G7Y89_g11330 [Cudoniella acicularis]|uniref:Uncharacterized protein n=1 Tax=Cudoniella acicularis TaxID=354080 RepID=A0A8H4RDV8_9HELO|nr:hypothetical protein G7Y89_g11330 [Cudoniella acicularis]
MSKPSRSANQRLSILESDTTPEFKILNTLGRSDSTTAVADALQDIDKLTSVAVSKIEQDGPRPLGNYLWELCLQKKAIPNPITGAALVYDAWDPTWTSQDKQKFLRMTIPRREAETAIRAACIWFVRAADRLWANIVKKRGGNAGGKMYEKKHWEGWNCGRRSIWKKGLKAAQATFTDVENTKLIEDALAQIKRVTDEEQFY